MIRKVSFKPQSEPYLNLNGKLHQSLGCPPLWFGLDLSGAPGAWGEESLFLNPFLLSLSLILPHFLHPDSASTFTKPHFGPKHRTFKRDAKEDGLKCVAVETLFGLFQPGTVRLYWNSSFQAGGMWGSSGVILSVTLTSSDTEKHSLRRGKKCLPLNLPRGSHLLCGLWGCGCIRGPPPPIAVLLHKKARKLLGS